MPLDPIRLQPFIDRVSSAATAYDLALRQRAEAERLLAANPQNTQALARLRAATRAAAQARVELDLARRTLDIERLRDLELVATSGDLLGSIPGTQVLGLFPVTLEARLESGRLRVRVWPDAISTSTHDPRLTPKERDAAQQYWRAEAGAAGEADSRAAWRALASAIGVTRAAWAAQALTPANRDDLAATVEPVFPPVAMQDDDAPFVPRAGVLPDRWILVGMKQGVKALERLGASIPHDLAIGLDTTPSETAGLTNEEGSPIQLPPRMRWLTDFALAVQVGMAFDVALAQEVDGFDELFVIGVRVTETPTQSALTLGDLFTGHRFSRGLAFVPQNTPTNNSDAGGSGLPSGSERIDYAFDLERRPRAFTALPSNGLVAARALGMAPEIFGSLPGSGAVAAVQAEPTGFEPELAAAMLTVLWQSSLGAFLEDFLQIAPGRATTMRTFLIESLRASGPIPAMRVGRQPYGMLPATALSDFVPAPSEAIDVMVPRVLRAVRSWFAMQRQPVVFTGEPEEALRLLGRSTRLYAETTPQVAQQPGPNRSQTLARSLQIVTRRQIDDDWRTGPIMAVGDAVPQPVARPVVDAETRDELAALAAASPQALLARPVPTSVLGRLARQAALLEWSRLARTAIGASVDLPSRRDLQAKARTNGSDVYINVLIRAFVQLPTLPVTPTTGTVITRRAIRRPGEEPFPEDPEPEDPDPDPDPRPETGEPEVTDEERARIRALVGNLATPLASCPGAGRLASFRAALARLAPFPDHLLETELFGVLDLCNHRVDAWFTALATRRLATVRATSPQGMVIGGWGCLQDVRRRDPNDPLQRAEYLHTPSLDQAAAAAVMRSAALRATGANSQHADIDLSSRRVRLARWILEGVRNGRSLGELLGVRFERAVKGTPGETHLAALRTRFAPANGFGVLNGLALQEAGPGAITEPTVLTAAEGMSEALDAVADALTAEAVYQIVKGHPENALATLERIARGEEPPTLTVTESPTPGVRLTHRVAIVIPADARAPGWEAGHTPRSRVEPSLDAWCGLMLGPASDTSLVVEHSSGAISVALSDVGVAAIDVVLGCRDDAGELAERLVLVARAGGPELVAARIRPDRAWKDLTGLGRSLAAVITHASSLEADAFEVPSALPAAADEAQGDLPARVNEAAATLATLRDTLAAGTDPTGVALRAAAFGVRVPGAALGADATLEQQNALKAAIEARLAGAGSPRDRLRALFGDNLPGVVAFVPRDASSVATATDPPPASLLGTDRLAPEAWLDAIGRSRSNVARLAEAFLRRETRGRRLEPLLVAQAPFVPGDRWIATSFRGTGGRPAAGRLAVVLHAPLGLAPTAPLGGLLIDAWTETVPARERDTAMALRFNNASTRAPQVVLLGVSPDPSKPWTVDTVIEVLRDTLTFARIRMQPETTLSRAGHMPLVYLGQRPGPSTISFTL